MTRDEAKALFRNDKDAYGKPKAVMSKIDKIFDDFETEIAQLKKAEDSATLDEIILKKARGGRGMPQSQNG